MPPQVNSPLTKTPAADLKLGRVFRYEVMAFAAKRWQIDSVIEGEEPAVARARVLLEDGKADEVKVVRQRTMSLTGFTTQTVVFQEARSTEKKGEIALSATLDKAPVCASPADLAGLESRILINRLLREFLDRFAITPTELLWDFAHLKRLQNQDNLLMAAIHHVARVQVQGPAQGQGQGERARALELVVEQAIALARELQPAKKALPVLDPADFDGFRRAVAARFPEPLRHPLTMARLADHLGEGRAWEHKLMLAAALVRDDLSPEALAIVDGIVADILGVGQMVQDLLGQQPSFGAALLSLGELIAGRVPDRPDLPEARRVVARLIGRLPASRRVLADRLVRELKSDKPLGRDPEAEREKLAQLKDKLRDPSGGLLGGAEAEAAFEARRIAVRKLMLRRMGLEG
jgi:hypothetical protein